jgi:hypothetical protein
MVRKSMSHFLTREMGNWQNRRAFQQQEKCKEGHIRYLRYSAHIARYPAPVVTSCSAPPNGNQNLTHIPAIFFL